MEKSTDKHYDGSYLKSTEEVLFDLKRSSYSPFEAIQSGEIVDLGCGIGRDAAAMSQSLSSELKVIGVDHDDKLLEEAAALNKSANLSFMQADAEALPFAEGQLDGLRTERMFQHLQNPEIVMDEIQRVLKKSGTLVILETDWSSLTLYSRHYAEQLKLVDYLVHKKVRNGLAAKNLGLQILKRGFNSITSSVMPFTIDNLEKANAYIQLETCLAEARTDSVMLDELKVLNESNMFRCSMNMVLHTAKK